jgi:type IV secretory pathway VirB6-like protein
MKKLLTLLFAAALTLSLSSVSFAQDTASADKKDDAKTETKAEKKASKKAKKSKKEKKDDMKKDDMAK